MSKQNRLSMLSAVRRTQDFRRKLSVLVIFEVVWLYGIMQKVLQVIQVDSVGEHNTQTIVQTLGPFYILKYRLRYLFSLMYWQ